MAAEASGERLEINRAPVMTLWAAVVAQRLGYDWEAALSLGRTVAGLNAQAKGRALGIFQAPREDKERKPERKRSRGEEFWVELLGRPVPAKNTEAGVRAVVEDKPVEPVPVQRYLEQKFGEHLSAAREAMAQLAASLDEDTLADRAYALYEKFRPQIESGKRSWGQKGFLDLGLIRRLAGSE